MSSKTKKDIEIQKSFYEGAFLRRQAELKNQELEGGKIAKDPQLRHLRAKVRPADRRLLAISKIQKQIEELALRKSERATEKLKDTEERPVMPEKLKLDTRKICVLNLGAPAGDGTVVTSSRNVEGSRRTTSQRVSLWVAPFSTGIIKPFRSLISPLRDNFEV